MYIYLTAHPRGRWGKRQTVRFRRIADMPKRIRRRVYEVIRNKGNISEITFTLTRARGEGANRKVISQINLHLHWERW